MEGKSSEKLLNLMNNKINFYYFKDKNDNLKVYLDSNHHDEGEYMGMKRLKISVSPDGNFIISENANIERKDF